MVIADCHAALEYSTFKVPYEVLNKKFRDTQKSLERQNARIRDASQDVSSKLGQNEEIPMEQVASPLATLKERLSQMEDLFQKAINEEIKLVDNMQKRVEYIEKRYDENADAISKWMWDIERIDRMVIGYLLRGGYLESAKQLAVKSKLTQMCDVDIFERAKKVEDSLLSRDTVPCMEWIQSHKSKLRRLGSSLELMVRVQEVIQMVRKGRRSEAVMYVRRHLSQAMNDGNDDVMRLMGLLACGSSTSISIYRELASDARWNVLVEVFREENSRIFQLADQSVLSACLQCGICAFKTPACSPGGNDRCVTCQPSVFALAEGLPYAHASNSRLICAWSGEPLNEDNLPWMLTTGRVYGKKAIEQLKEGDIVRCPKTEQITSYKHIQRLYIL